MEALMCNINDKHAKLANANWRHCSSVGPLSLVADHWSPLSKPHSRSLDSILSQKGIKALMGLIVSLKVIVIKFSLQPS